MPSPRAPAQPCRMAVSTQPGKTQPLRPHWAPALAPTACSPGPGRGDRAAPPPQGQVGPNPGRVGRHELCPTAPAHVLSGVPRKRRGSSGSEEAQPSPFRLTFEALRRSLQAPYQEQQSPRAWAAGREGGREGGRRGGGGVSCWDGAAPRLCQGARPGVGAGAQHPRWDTRTPGRSSALGHGAREPREKRDLLESWRGPQGRKGDPGKGEGGGAPRARGAPVPCPIPGGAEAGCTSRLPPASLPAAASPLLLQKSTQPQRGRPSTKARAAPRRVGVTGGSGTLPRTGGGR